VRRRSTIRLSDEDIAQGFALACQTVVEGDITVSVPPQAKIERLLTSDRTVGEVTAPAGYDPLLDQTIQSISVTLTPPDMSDQTDDWSRLLTAMRQQAGIDQVQISLPLMRKLGNTLRSGEWDVTAILDMQAWDRLGQLPRLIDLRPGISLGMPPLWATAIDIGTTTVTVWLIDLITGDVRAQVAQYNAQIARGEM
jgi:uncharacterized 2Fe-2S/4Fe-4S cluster protein (DUF4445 family)